MIHKSFDGFSASVWKAEMFFCLFSFLAWLLSSSFGFLLKSLWMRMGPRRDPLRSAGAPRSSPVVMHAEASKILCAARPSPSARLLSGRFVELWL